MRVNQPIERDPFNTAVAAVLTRLAEDDNTGPTRLVKITGISRATIDRYLNGERDIKVAELRKIAAALHVDIAEILAEAERSIE